MCGVKGHLKRMSNGNKRGNHFLQRCLDTEGDDGKNVLIFNIRSYSGEPMQEYVTVNNVNLLFEVDTGSAVTAISDSVYRAHFANYKLDNTIIIKL